jgi:hypothetical protein
LITFVITREKRAQGEGNSSHGQLGLVVRRLSALPRRITDALGASIDTCLRHRRLSFSVIALRIIGALRIGGNKVDRHAYAPSMPEICDRPIA